MENNINFSLQRVIRLIRNDIWEGYKLVGIIALAIFGFFLIPYLNLDLNEHPTRHELLYIMLLFGGGLIFTSVIFRELYTKPRGQFYLTLPASPLEKITSKWILSAILYPIGATIGYGLFSIIGNSIYSFLHGASPSSFLSYWQTSYNQAVPFFYLLIQSIVFVGAVTFTKYNIFKTGFSLFLGWIAFTLISVFLFRLVMWEYFDGMQFPNAAMRGLEPGAPWNSSFPVDVSPTLVLLLVVPYLLMVSYFKLKEREI